LTSALAQFWLVHSLQSEGRRRFAAALAANPTAPLDLRARAMWEYGRLAHFQGAREEAEALLTSSAAMLEALGDDMRWARAMSTLGLAAISRGDYARAIEAFEASVERSRAIGDTLGLATTNTNYGRALLELGRLAEARSLLEESISVVRVLGDDWGLAVALGRLGIVARLQGAHEEALAVSRESVQWCLGLNDRRVMATGMQTMGLIALARNRHREAAQLLAIAQQLRAEIGTPLYPAEQASFERTMAEALARIGPAETEAARAEVRSMSAEEMVRHANADLSPLPGAFAPARASGLVRDRGPLSEREATIAGLVADGHTNQQIAEHLVISERTVETHVRNIRTRLGLPNRASVAAWAVAHGLAARPHQCDCGD
jgi:DNA-binding NarL/FixJ family response regulator